ncbi:MAG: hydrogenase maturation nickel metallochaperone HypA [Candidatus Thorarchaeota archaeon]
MHEFSAACSIVDTALEAAKNNKATKVSVVNIEVGEFTFLIPEQLVFNFEIASRNSILEGAELRIKTVKGRLFCNDCGFEGDSLIDPNIPDQIAAFAPMKCSKCGSSSTKITGGKDFVITSIEAEIAGSTAS